MVNVSSVKNSPNHQVMAQHAPLLGAPLDRSFCPTETARIAPIIPGHKAMEEYVLGRHALFKNDLAKMVNAMHVQPTIEYSLTCHLSTAVVGMYMKSKAMDTSRISPDINASTKQQFSACSHQRMLAQKKPQNPIAVSISCILKTLPSGAADAVTRHQ